MQWGGGHCCGVLAQADAGWGRARESGLVLDGAIAPHQQHHALDANCHTRIVSQTCPPSPPHPQRRRQPCAPRWEMPGAPVRSAAAPLLATPQLSRCPQSWVLRPSRSTRRRQRRTRWRRRPSPKVQLESRPKLRLRPSPEAQQLGSSPKP